MLTGAIECVLETEVEGVLGIEVEGVLKDVVEDECELEGGGGAGELLDELLVEDRLEEVL